jgi:hypothetical protein
MGQDGFTSPPKEGMLRIFSAEKSDKFGRGLNPRTWVPEASMLTTRPPKPLLYNLRFLRGAVGEEEGEEEEEKNVYGRVPIFTDPVSAIYRGPEKKCKIKEIFGS